MLREQLKEFYLDYVNNFMTTDALADAYHLTFSQAYCLVEIGREIHEQDAENARIRKGSQ